MARPRGMPPELLPPAQGEEAEAGGAPGAPLPNALEGYVFRAGTRGPATTLRPSMIPIIAEALARTGVKRIAAAKAHTTEDCLGKWLKRGADAMARGKRSLYTQLLLACEEAWAHRYSYLIELGERTVTDRHCNPRFVTWLMGVTAPKTFTVPKEPAQGAVKSGLGPAFELLTPEEAARSLDEKLSHFLSTEKRVEQILAAAVAPAASSAEAPGAE